MNTNAKDEVRFLDSRCSDHMAGTKDRLFDFDSFIESWKLGDDSNMLISYGKTKHEVVYWWYDLSDN